MNIVLEPAILVQILDRILVQTLDQTEIVVLVHVLQDISGMDKDAQQFLTIAILDMFGVQTLAFILDHQTIVEIIKFGMEDNVLSQLLAQLTNIIMEPVVYQSLILVLLDTLGAIQVVLLSLLLQIVKLDILGMDMLVFPTLLLAQQDQLGMEINAKLQDLSTVQLDQAGMVPLAHLQLFIVLQDLLGMEMVVLPLLFNVLQDPSGMESHAIQLKLIVHPDSNGMDLLASTVDN